MKKILAILLILVLSLTYMVSCDKIPGLDKLNFKFPWQKDEAPAATVTLDDAKNYLFSTYKDNAAAPMGDYDLVAKVIIDGTTFNVTWSVSLDTITIKESTKANFWTVDLPEKNETETQYVLTATITDADGNKVEVKFNKTLPVIDSTGVETTLTEGVAYKLYFEQVNLGYTLYALNTTQNDQNKFINSTLDPKEAADFYVEAVDGGYKIYTEVNGVKTYMYAKVTRSEDPNTGAIKYSKFIGFNTEEGSVFTYNTTKGGVWTVTVDNLVYGVGTYGSYTTISLSDESYFTPDNVGSSQYVMQFMTSEYANTLDEDKLPESPSDAKGILDQLYALADGESAAGDFTLTGKIIALDGYNNPTIVVEGYENMPVYCYRLTVENKIGDVITVFVKSFDAEKKRISLGYKTAETNPWYVFTHTYAEGDVASVKIVSMMPFGAFAEIVDGVDGLIHISQIAQQKIGKPADVLELGQVVDAKIIAIDEEKQKVSLSIRALLDEAQAEAEAMPEDAVEADAE